MEHFQGYALAGTIFFFLMMEGLTFVLIGVPPPLEAKANGAFTGGMRGSSQLTESCALRKDTFG